MLTNFREEIAIRSVKTATACLDNHEKSRPYPRDSGNWLDMAAAYPLMAEVHGADTRVHRQRLRPYAMSA